tara:strand:- start:80932 stop:81612 length:681 start_codon:yes stop_codon:yes gene_type:complete
MLVAVSLFLGLKYFQGASELERLSVRTAELKQAEVTTTLLIRNLHSEVRDIRAQLRQFANSSNPVNTVFAKADSGSEELLQRIASLEDSINELSLRRSPNQKNGDNDNYHTLLSQSDQQSGEMSALNRNALAETAFNSDSGVPLGEYAESVEKGVHETASVEIQDLECRTSICKVTFSVSDSSTAELADGRSEVVDQLISRADGREVDIQHANDVYGNKVMYVQLR